MAEILLYGIIGDSFDKLDAATVTSAIRGSTGPLSVRINSPGGYVMEGLAIIEALRSYPAKVTIYIDGLAASMASAIAMVGAETIMAESALMMVHKPWDSSIGNADDLRRDASKLDRIEAQLIGIYAKRTGLPEGELAAMLAAETWMTPDEALAQGFITSIAAPLQIAAMARATGYGFRHLPERLKQQEAPLAEENDTTQAVALERTRISTIMALGTKHGVPGTLTQDLVTRGVALDQARAAILDHLAAEGDRLNIGHTHGPGSGHQTLDNPDVRAKAMSDALAARLQNKPAEGPASEYRGLSLAAMAREHLSRNGVCDVHRLPDDRVAALAFQPSRGPLAAGYHTTSDFPQIMQAGVETSLLEQYRIQQSALKLLTSPRDVPDFKAQTLLRVAAFGTLDQVNEAGEYKSKSMIEASESFKVATFGNTIAFTRQLLINDSVGALSDFTRSAARAAANVEADVLAATINSNPTMSDGNAWFHAAHKNVATSGGVPSVGTLDAARMAMRAQKDLDGSLIDAQPKFLLVPIALETAAQTLIAATVTPGTQTDPNPFAGKLVPIADPRIINPTAWYLFADPTFAPAFLSVYLDGHREPFVDSKDGWNTDGTEFKVRHDFGAGVVDAKMAYKNPGT